MFKTEPLYSPTGKQGSAKNLNNLLADDEDADQPEAQPQSLIEQLLSFFAKLWSPGTSDAEKLGYSYVYDEDGTLLGEYGAGGSQSSGTANTSTCPPPAAPCR